MALDVDGKGWVKKTVMLKSGNCPEITVHPSLFPAFVINWSLGGWKEQSSVNLVLLSH